MTPRVSESRIAWLLLGFVAGLGVAAVWPHEPVQASSTDRSAQFAIATGSVNTIDPIEGVYTLDFLTGDLKGAVLNRQVGKFTTFYYRNVSKDFEVDTDSKPSYALVTGTAQLQGRAGFTPATNIIYVAELTSGKVACYGFAWRETIAPIPPNPFVPIDTFLFREPLQKE